MKVNMELLEQKKLALCIKYESDVAQLYVYELHKVFTWFVKKYPKRHLRWISAMGSNFFVLDGEVLDNRQFTEDRIAKCIGPLLDLTESINDVTNTSNDGWIQTCDVNSNDYHFNPDFHPAFD